MSTARRRIALAAVAATALALVSCGGRTSPPAPADAPLADELAHVTWIAGAPLAADSLTGRIVVVARWTIADPRAHAFLAKLETLRAAYAPLGVQFVAEHTEPATWAADTSAVTREVRRLGYLGAVATLAEAAPAETEVRVFARDGRPAARGFGLAGLSRADAAIQAAIEGASPGALAGASPRASLRRVPLAAGKVREGPLATAVAGLPQVFAWQLRPQEEGPREVPIPSGRWTPSVGGLVAARAGAANYLVFRYHAARVGVVASPLAGTTAKLWILRDDAWLPPEAAGEDVKRDASGATYVELDGTRAYRVAIGGGEHVLKFSPDAEGVTLHELTLDESNDD